MSRWLSISLLLLFFGRLVSAAVGQSATFDEPLHIMQGVFYWRVWELYSVVQNPPLINAWLGWPVALLIHPVLPVWDTAAVFQDWLPVSRAFMWQDNAGLTLLFVARLAIIWLALLSAAAVFRWSQKMWHSTAAGLFTLALFTTEPNILAHASLATTDFGTAVAFALAVWAIGRAAAHPTRGRVLLAGAALGLLASAKFSAIILLPAIALLALWRWASPAPRSPLSPQHLALSTFFAVAIFAAVYRLNGAAVGMDWALQQAHQAEGHSAYLLGQRSLVGWWYYFPMLLASKTPLVALGVAAAAVGGHIWRRTWQWPVWWPWLVAGGILAAGMVSHVNIGYRYLLPMLPLVCVGAGWLAQAQPHWATGAAVWLTVAGLAVHPHYLAYFNPVAGGLDEGWRVAVDSNYDWGQDLGRVAPLLADVPPERRFFSYFGSADWGTYGVQAQPLPGWPTARPNPLYDVFYPAYPAPGRYALSVTQLLGVYLDDPARFAYFQGQTAAARAGQSIFVYDVPAHGAPVGLALSGLGVGAIALADWQAGWASNDVRLRWYDSRTSLLIPAAQGETAAWTAVGTGHWPTLPALSALYPAPTLSGASAELPDDGPTLAYTMHLWPPVPVWPPATAVATPPTTLGQTLTLVGYEWHAAEQELGLLTFWEVAGETTADLKLFVHVVDTAGNLVAQHDGLDVRPTGWRVGDKIAQWHTLPLPPEWGTAAYTVRLGAYNAADFTRLPTAAGAEWLAIAPNH